MAKAGRITIDLSAGTAQFVLDLDRANAKLSDFDAKSRGAGRSLDEAAAKGTRAGRMIADGATHGVTGIQGASGALRVLEGNLNNNIRAGERFLVNILGLGPALKSIFPIVGGIALLGIFEHLIGKVNEWREAIQKAEAAPARITDEFRKLTNATELSNDELRVTNDKLENEIAKLEGKPGNGLKLALDEAMVSADKLAASLHKDFEEITKLFKEENIGDIKAFFTGEASTEHIKKAFLGDDGFEGFQSRLAAEEDDLKNRQRLIRQFRKDGAIDEKEAGKEDAEAREQDRKIVTGILNEEIQATKQDLATLTGLQEKHLSEIKSIGGYFTPKQKAGIALDTGLIRMAQNRLDDLELQAQNETDVKKKDQLEKRTTTHRDPFGDEMKLLDAEVKGVLKELNAVGQSQSAKTLAKSFADATKEIEKTNKALRESEKPRPPLTQKQETEIVEKFTARDALKEELSFQQSFVKGSAAIADRIRLQDLLTEATGKGYEAIKRATVAGKLAQEIGPEKFSDPEFRAAHQPEIRQRTLQLNTEYDSQRATTLANENDKLKDQIELEESLTAAQARGANALQLITFAYRVKHIAEDEGLPIVQSLIDKEISLAEAEKRTVDIEKLTRQITAVAGPVAPAVTGPFGATLPSAPLTGEQEQAAKRIRAELAALHADNLLATSNASAGIGFEIAAVERLTAAQIGGLKAVREARLQNQIAEIERTAPASTEEERKAKAVEIERVTQLNRAQYEEQITTEALKTGLAYQNQLQSIDEQIARLREIQATQGDTLAIEISLKKLTQERTKILSEQVAVLGSARDGLRAFFQEMAADGKSAAAEVHDALSNAFSSLNDELAKILSGQKASWQHFFQGISEQLAKQALQRLEASVAGVIFGDGQPKQPKVTGPFGIPLPTAPVATSGNTNHPQHHGLRGILDKLFGADKTRSGRTGSSPSDALYVIPVGYNGVPPGSIPDVPGNGKRPGDPGGPPSDNPNDYDFGGPNHKPLPPWPTGLPINAGPLGTPSGDVNGPPSIFQRPSGTADLTLAPFPELSQLPISNNSELAQLGNIDFLGGAGSRPGIGTLPLAPPYEGFAAGGDVEADKTILVGEKGPELFVPPSAGKIVPNHKLQSFEAFANGSDLSDLMLPFATGNAYSDAPASPAKGSGGGLFADLDQDGQTDSTPLFVALTNQGVAEAVPVVPAQIANQASAVAGSSRTTETINSYAGLAANAIGPILKLADPSNPNTPPGTKLGSSPGNPLYVSEVARPGTADQTSNRTFAPTSTSDQNVFGSIAGVAGPGLEQLSATPGLDGSAALGLQAAGMAVNVLGGLFGSSDSGSSDNTSSDPFFGDPFSASGGNDIITGSSLQPGGASLDGPAGGVINSIVGLFNKSGDAPTGGKQGASASNPLYVKDVSSGGSSGGGGLGGGLGSLLGMFGGGGGAAAGSAGAADAFSLGDAADLGLIGGAAEGGHIRGHQPILVGEKGPELFMPKTHGTIIPNHRMNAFLKTFGGPRAMGGDVNPSQAYLVGEQGPELMMSAVHNASSNSIGSRNVNATGGNVFYTINTGGADATLVEKRVNTALRAIHGSAIQQGFEAHQEHVKRTPQS